VPDAKALSAVGFVRTSREADERACLVEHQPGFGEEAVTLGADGAVGIDSSSDRPDLFARFTSRPRIAPLIPTQVPPRFAERRRQKNTAPHTRRA
jgi:sugar/nucleoside kinase (ribokinase family)